MILEFTVYGTAIPKGSTKAFGYYAKNRATGQLLLNKHGKPILLASTSNANAKTKGWQSLVAEAASHAIQALPVHERGLLTEGVRLTAAFFLPRPKSLPKKVTAHTKAPDLDKLLRSLGDSMTKVVFRDDAQIVEIVAQKLYAAAGDPPHVEISIAPTQGAIQIPRDQPLFEMVGR